MKIITGMHRSGTSLVARLFYEAGANMGDPDTFYRPDQWNPDGYYEQPDIHAINMPLINGKLWKFAYFWLPSTSTILKRATKFHNQIEETAEKYDNTIVKETRFSLTMPAWLKYGTDMERVLICLREPIQVAKSIQKRNHTFLRHGLWLWRLHNERLLENVPDGTPVWYLNYHNLLNPDNYLEELKGAFKFMDVHLPDDQILELLQKYVKPGMNHHANSETDYPPRIARLWDTLICKYNAQMGIVDKDHDCIDE